MSDFQTDFAAAIRDAGLTPPKTIIADGKLHRFASNGKRDDDAGWYVLHDGDLPAGAFGDWRSGVEKTWRADIGRKLKPEERAAFKARMRETQRKREAEKKRRQADASLQAWSIWRQADPAPADHPYLVKKCVQPHGARVHEGKLIVPVCAESTTLHSLQKITPDGDKTFLFGGRVEGCFCLIGKPDDVICIAEGFATAASIYEATGIAVAAAFNCGNLKAAAVVLRARFPGAELIICADDDKKTPGNPGMREARKAAREIVALLAVPDFGNCQEGGDFNDLHLALGQEAVRACIKQAALVVEETPEQDPKANGNGADRQADSGAGVDIDLEIARLAKLRPADYERERKAAAEKLGMRASILDKLVAALRPADKVGQGRPLKFEPPELWPEPVNGAVLLNEIAEAIRRYVVLTPDEADATALWCLHTYLYDRFVCTPRLAITSPQKQCGKTTLLDVIDALAARSLSASNISAAAVYRAVEISRPTLLIDEADTFLGEAEELRGVLNSGHRRGGQVVRTAGDDFEPRVFSTFSPCAIAMIGRLPDTLADRSIAITLKRAALGETISRFRADRIDDLRVLARKAARWAADHAEAIAEADPVVPEQIYNRAADNWRPLLAIAAEADGGWLWRAEKAALAQHGKAAGDDSLKIMLLRDIRDAFGDKAHMSSEEIVNYLIGLEDRPWAEASKGKPLTKNQLARWLKPFEIAPVTIRSEAWRAKGYYRVDFEDAWQRYAH